MFAPPAPVLPSDKCGRGPGRYTRSKPIVARLVIVLLLSLTACAPQAVRVPVPPEDIIRANELAREADLAFARRDYYAALIKYLEASRLNPNSQYIYNKLGIAYSQLKYYAEAGSAFQRSIALDRKFAYAHNNLGTVYFAMNDKNKAEKCFKKAIALRENTASFHVNLGTLYFEKGKFEKGMAELRRGLMLDPGILAKSDGVNLSAASSRGQTTEKSYSMARVYASLGDVDRTVENLQQALNNGFTDIEAIRREPDFDKVRQDSKFIAFMQQASLITKN